MIQPYSEHCPHLAHEVVVDLGPGSQAWGFLVSELGGARGYVGVEPNFAVDLLDRIAAETRFSYQSPFFRNEYAPRNPERSQILPFEVVQEDMLAFLKRLSDQSVSVLMSGIDGSIIDDRNYRSAVSAEILRVLSKQGAYIGEGWPGHIPLQPARPRQKKFDSIMVNNA